MLVRHAAMHIKGARMANWLGGRAATTPQPAAQPAHTSGVGATCEQERLQGCHVATLCSCKGALLRLDFPGGRPPAAAIFVSLPSVPIHMTQWYVSQTEVWSPDANFVASTVLLSGCAKCSCHCAVCSSSLYHTATCSCSYPSTASLAPAAGRFCLAAHNLSE